MYKNKKSHSVGHEQQLRQAYSVGRSGQAVHRSGLPARRSSGIRAGCIKTLNIYVKPEEYKAYYVINDKFFGSVDLF